MNKLINIKNVRLALGWLVIIAFSFCDKLEDAVFLSILTRSL